MAKEVIKQINTGTVSKYSWKAVHGILTKDTGGNDKEGSLVLDEKMS